MLPEMVAALLVPLVEVEVEVMEAASTLTWGRSISAIRLSARIWRDAEAQAISTSPLVVTEGEAVVFFRLEVE